MLLLSKSNIKVFSGRFLGSKVREAFHSFLAIGFIFGLSTSSTSTFAATEVIVQDYTISPSTSSANQSFSLTLNGGPWYCGTGFTQETVTVSTNRIDLSFIVNSNLIPLPVIQTIPSVSAQGTTGSAQGLSRATIIPAPPICAYDVKAATLPTSNSATVPLLIDTASPPPIYYGTAPSFQIPSLRPGKYEVWATQDYACLHTKPACALPLQSKYAGTLIVTPEVAVTYSINPTQTAAAKDFTLELLSYQFNCATYYDMQNVSVNGNEISLTFLDHENPAGLCPAIYKPYGPSFKIAALSAGTYKVTAYRLPACAAQGCKMAAMPADAGTLTVLGTGIKEGWYLKEKNILANKAFTLQLLNNKYGNCQNTFSHTSISTSGKFISTSFLIENHPEGVCIQNIKPYGPSYEMQGLAVGVYPITVTELMACEVTAPFCAVDRWPAPPSDTLIVSTSLSILISEMRAQTGQAIWNGKTIAFNLPVSASSSNSNLSPNRWEAQVLSLNGKVLFSQTISTKMLQRSHGSQGSQRQRAEITLNQPLEKGIYILRLQAKNQNERSTDFSLPLVIGK